MLPWIHLLDALALEFAAQGYNEVGVAAAFIVSALGNPLSWFFVASYLYWKGDRRKAFHVMLLVMCASVLSGALKSLFRRPRPSMKALLSLPEPLSRASEYFVTYSFPSGHSIIIGSFYGFFRRHLSRRKHMLLFLALLAVGIARLYLGVHYLTDVVAGMLLGLFLGEIVFHVEKRFGEELHSLEYPHGRVGLVLIAAVLLTALIMQLPILALPPLGFFLGHFYSMHKKKHKTEFYWRKETIGFGGLGAIALAALYAPSPLQEALFFLFGLWVTLLYPRLYNRFLKKGRRN